MAATSVDTKPLKAMFSIVCIILVSPNGASGLAMALAASAPCGVARLSYVVVGQLRVIEIFALLAPCQVHAITVVTL